jgi:hypothetical protein
MNNDEEILNKSCLICGKLNRYHTVFWSPYYGCYVKQSFYTDDTLKIFVPSHDHYACINNLEYLEWKYNNGIK